MFKKTLAVARAAACLGVLAAGQAVADESTTIGGKMYADFTYLDQKSNDARTAASGTGIDVKRFYLSATHAFSDIWSANITTDFNYVSNDSQTQLFVKKAYVQAKLSDAFIGRLGSADLPWVPYVEDLYAYRWVETTVAERLKFATSADWGINGNGKLADGLVNYSLSVVNGNGYRNPSRSKAVDVEGRVGFIPIDGLNFAVGFYSGKLGKDVAGAATPPVHTAQRFDALLAYVKNDLRLGAEYFQAKDWNNVTSAVSDKADGFSLWASYNFMPELGVFARADSAKPSKDLNPDLKDRYYNAGLVYHARKNIDFALAWKHEKVDGGASITSINTSNGSIGGTRDGKYDEVGVWTQVAF